MKTQINFIENIEELCLGENSNLDDLIQVLNKKVNINFGSGFALIVDTNENLVGVVEDSDLRKSLKSKSTSEFSIRSIMRRDFISISLIEAKKSLIETVIQKIEQRGWETVLPVKIIPVTDNKKPVGLIDMEEIYSEISKWNNNNIVIGLGYVGITLAATFAINSRKTIGIDNNEYIVNNLKKIDKLVHEPGLVEIIQKCLNKNFYVFDDLSKIDINLGVRNNFFICVNTPLNSSNQPNMENVDNVVDNIIKYLKKGDCIIMRSTVPIGTGFKIIRKIEHKKDWKVGIDFHYIAAPERTVEGNALNEIRELPQLIAGATEACLAYGLGIFNNIINTIVPLENLNSAEMGKILCNAYRDFSFSFSNFLIEIAQREDIDLNRLIESVNFGYPRSLISKPSPGVGGPCLTKDSYFLTVNKNLTNINLLVNARTINEKVPRKSVSFIEQHIDKLHNFKLLGVGLAFKGIPEVNDIRNSTSLDFLNLIKKRVKCTYIWDAIVEYHTLDLDYLPYDSKVQYDFYAVLNNNPKNLDFIQSELKRTDLNEIVIYDPWRIINPDHIKPPKNLEKLHYLSLTNYKIIQFADNG